MKKTGQMEMIGLVVIVILITLGMLFMAQFALNDKPEKKIFTRKGLAYSTMSAVLKTTINDPACVEQFTGEPVYPQMGKDILEDCAINRQNAPNGYSVYHCNNEHSCVFARGKIQELLDSTLGSWNKRYEFSVELLDVQGAAPEELLEPIAVNGGCPKTRDRDSSELFFIQTDAGLIESILYLCD